MSQYRCGSGTAKICDAANSGEWGKQEESGMSLFTEFRQGLHISVLKFFDS